MSRRIILVGIGCHYAHVGELLHTCSVGDIIVVNNSESSFMQEIEEFIDVVELKRERTTITRASIDELVFQLGKINPVDIPEDKVYCTKPYQPKLTKSKFVRNNFNRSGFQVSGKLARGRI